MTGIGGRKHDAKGHSTGTVKKRSGVGQIEGPFRWHKIEMVQSPAWRALSLTDRRILDRLDCELAHHGGKDNGNLPCTYRDFLAFGVGDPHAIKPSLCALEALGFIKVKWGRAGNGDFGEANIFLLTYRDTAYEKPTDDWTKIETDEQARAVATAARKAALHKKPRRRKSRKPL